MVSDEQIKSLAERLTTLARCLNIEQRRIDLQNEEEKTQEPNFWDDPDRAQEQLRKVSSIKSWIEEYDFPPDTVFSGWTTVKREELSDPEPGCTYWTGKPTRRD